MVAADIVEILLSLGMCREPDHAAAAFAAGHKSAERPDIVFAGRRENIHFRKALHQLELTFRYDRLKRVLETVYLI